MLSKLFQSPSTQMSWLCVSQSNPKRDSFYPSVPQRPRVQYFREWRHMNDWIQMKAYENEDKYISEYWFYFLGRLRKLKEDCQNIRVLSQVSILLDLSHSYLVCQSCLTQLNTAPVSWMSYVFKPLNWSYGDKIITTLHGSDRIRVVIKHDMAAILYTPGNKSH